MTRGKQAALASERRYRASLDHLDRVTNELLDAKERARRYQADAARVPHLVTKIDELQRQLDAGESDRMRGLRAECDARVQAAEARTLEVAGITAEMIRASHDKGEVMIPVHAIEAWDRPNDPASAVIRDAVIETDKGYVNRRNRRDQTPSEVNWRRKVVDETQDNLRSEYWNLTGQLDVRPRTNKPHQPKETDR